MSIYGLNFARESTSEPVLSDNGETTIPNRPIVDVLPREKFEKHTVRFLRKESRVKMIFIQLRQNATSHSPRPMNLTQNFLLARALHRSI